MTKKALFILPWAIVWAGLVAGIAFGAAALISPKRDPFYVVLLVFWAGYYMRDFQRWIMKKGDELKPTEPKPNDKYWRS